MTTNERDGAQSERRGAVPGLSSNGELYEGIGRIALADEALKALEDEILLNRSVGKVIQGMGGLRKMRFAAPGSSRGKSSGFRVCYVDFTEFGFIFLVPPAEKRAAAAFIDTARRSFKQRETQ